MKLLYLVIMGASFTASFAQSPVNFDIWNKTNEPLYFEVGNPQNPPKGWDLKLLNATGKEEANIITRFFNFLRYGLTRQFNVKEQGTFHQDQIDSTQPVLILLSRTRDLKNGSQVALLTINPHKDVIIRIKEDPNGIALFKNDRHKYVIDPQKGPLEGSLGYSERLLPLANNVTSSDISINTNYVIQEKDFSPKEKELLRHKEFKLMGEQQTDNPF